MHVALAVILPLALSSVLQLFYNAADVVVVGRFAGSRSLAAVGSNSSLINLLINLVIGLSVGASVLTAQYWGARRTDPIRDIAAIALRGAALIGGAFAAAALLAPGPLARLVTDKPEVAAAGVAYLRTVGASYLLFALSQTLLLTLRTVEIVSVGLVNAAVALLLIILIPAGVI